MELNILDRLSEGPMTVPEMAGTLGFDPRPVERLMVALTSLKLLDRADGVNTLMPEAQRLGHRFD